MQLLRQSSGERLILNPDAPLGAGGEARIYAVLPGREFVAKIYYQPGPVQANKLRAMLANPPEDPMAGAGHISIAWPLDMLHSADTPRFVGYLMPRVSDTLPIFTYYNPSARRRHSPLFNTFYLHRAARNLAAAVRALHDRGYVIGDVNESNILVSDTALVTLVDTDSFQVREAGRVYRCPVGKPEYTPPEMQGRSFADSDRLPEQDLFGLAVLLFQLLMEGTHPFAGLYLKSGDPPPYEERILAGHFPYGTRKVPYEPMPAAPPFEMLHPTLRELFLRCFEEGHRLPSARPDAQTWQAALVEAEAALTTCAINPQHRYGAHLTACPWCERTRQFGGRDPFPLRPLALPDKPARSSLTTPRPAALSRSGVASPSSAPFASPPSSRYPTQTSPQPGNAGVTFPRNPWAWGAFWSTAVALFAPTTVTPIVNVLCGLASLFFAIAARRSAPRYGGSGKWLAGTTAAMGAFMALYVLPNLVAQIRGPGAVEILPMLSGVRALTFSPDGMLLASGSNRAEDQRLIGGEVALWDVRSGNMEQTLADYPGNVVSLAYLPDGRALIVGADSPLGIGEFDLLDARLRGARRRLASAHGIQAVACSPDGALAAGGSQDGNVFLWDVRTGGLLHRWERQGLVSAVAFSSDSRRIAVGSGSASGAIAPGSVTLYDTQDFHPLWKRMGHGNGTLAVAFSPDGRLLATAGRDSIITLRHVQTGATLQSMESGSRDTTCLAFSPDGAILASGSSRQVAGETVDEICLWNPRDGSKLRALLGHRDRICALAFSPDGSKLASASLDSTVRIWRLKNNP